MGWGGAADRQTDRPDASRERDTFPRKGTLEVGFVSDEWEVHSMQKGRGIWRRSWGLGERSNRPGG